MSSEEIEKYLEFWSAAVEEERALMKANRDQELFRRKASYALWIASRRVSAGKHEQQRRLSPYKPE